MSQLLVSIDGVDVAIEVRRKQIRHCYIRVDRDTGAIRVSAPVRMSDEAVRGAILARRDWILRRQRALLDHANPSRPEYVSGESVSVFGVVHRLSIVTDASDSRPEIGEGPVLLLRVRPDATREEREALLERWYRVQLEARIPPLIRAWERVMNVQVREWKIRRMRTRWGSCNIHAHRIWLNFELVRLPARCLEYVLVHEMTHLHERGHNSRFYALMDHFLPDWRETRAILNDARIT